MSSPLLIVYSRRGCHLCERLIEELLPLIRDRARLEVVDIDEDASIKARYDVRVPVLEHEGVVVCEAFLDRDALEKSLEISTG